MFERHKRGSGSATLFYEQCKNHQKKIEAVAQKELAVPRYQLLDPEIETWMHLVEKRKMAKKKIENDELANENFRLFLRIAK